MSDFEGQAAVDAADDETSVGTAVAMDDDYTKPRGWRHGATWTYLIMLLASAVALLVSFILSADTLKMARNPGQKLNCDVNAVLSCSTVAESWQAEIVKFAGLSFPNAFWLGGLAALAYSYWLTTQSLFVINAMCPWCLVLMFSTTVQFMALSHATVAVQDMPSGHAGLRKYYRLNFDLMVDVVWIVALIVVILVKDGPMLFA